MSSSSAPSAPRAHPLTWRSAVAALLILTAGAATLTWHRHLPLVREARGKNLPLMVAWDSGCYYHIAIGEHARVPSPFSKRVLYPWLAASLAKAFHVDVSIAFATLNFAAFALLAVCISAVLEIMIGNAWLALLLLLTPMPLEALELGYLPDLFHTALTALFFLLLLKEKTWPALAVMLVAFATRESTLLLCLVSAAVAYRCRDRLLFVGSLAVLVMGVILTSAFARRGAPNLHHLPDLLYLGLKVPFNFCLNFLGLTIWTDVTNIGQPVVKWHVPAFLHRLVTDREIGLNWDWRIPIRTFIVCFTTFGTGPLLLGRFRKERRTILKAPLPIQLACFYGVLCYVVGPALGSWVERLVAYGWPAFWIALPWLIQHYFPPLKTSESLLLGLNFLCLAWWPSLFGWSPSTNYPLCALGLLLCVPTVLLLRRLPALAPSPTTTPAAVTPMLD